MRRPEDPAASQYGEQPALAPPGLHGARPPPRPARRSPPPLQGAPRSSGLLGAGAALLGRAWLGSSPAHSHTFAHLQLALSGPRRRWRRRRSHCRGLTGLSCSARSPASKARREAPPRARPLALGLGWWAAPPRSPRVPAHCPTGLASPLRALRPRPERAAEECGPIADRKATGAGRMVITFLRPGAGNPS